MEKETNISPEQINSFLNALKGSASSPEDAKKAMESSLSESQIEKVKSILSDEEKLKQLLSSPLAKALLEKYKKGN